MNSYKGLALLGPGIIFFVIFTLVNSFTDGIVKLVLLLLPSVIILVGVTLICSGDNTPTV